MSKSVYPRTKVVAQSCRSILKDYVDLLDRPGLDDEDPGRSELMERLCEFVDELGNTLAEWHKKEDD